MRKFASEASSKYRRERNIDHDIVSRKLLENHRADHCAKEVLNVPIGDSKYSIAKLECRFIGGPEGSNGGARVR